jgi:hypothetical protein
VTTCDEGSSERGVTCWRDGIVVGVVIQRGRRQLDASGWRRRYDMAGWQGARRSVLDVVGGGLLAGCWKGEANCRRCGRCGMWCAEEALRQHGDLKVTMCLTSDGGVESLAGVGVLKHRCPAEMGDERVVGRRRAGTAALTRPQTPGWTRDVAGEYGAAITSDTAVSPLVGIGNEIQPVLTRLLSISRQGVSCRDRLDLRRSGMERCWGKEQRQERVVESIGDMKSAHGTEGSGDTKSAQLHKNTVRPDGISRVQSIRGGGKEAGKKETT